MNLEKTLPKAWEKIDEVNNAKPDKSLVKQLPHESLLFGLQVENGKLNWWSKDPRIKPQEIESVRNLGGGAFTSATGKFAGLVYEDGLYIGKGYKNIITGMRKADESLLEIIGNTVIINSGDYKYARKILFSTENVFTSLNCYIYIDYELVEGEENLYFSASYNGSYEKIEDFLKLGRHIISYKYQKENRPINSLDLIGNLKYTTKTVIRINKIMLVPDVKTELPYVPYGVEVPYGNLILEGTENLDFHDYSYISEGMALSNSLNISKGGSGDNDLIYYKNINQKYIRNKNYSNFGFRKGDLNIAKYKTLLTIQGTNNLYGKIKNIYIYDNVFSKEDLEKESLKNIYIPTQSNPYAVPDMRGEPENLYSEILGLPNGGSLNNANTKQVGYAYWDYKTRKYYECVAENTDDFVSAEKYKELSVKSNDDKLNYLYATNIKYTAKSYCKASVMRFGKVVIITFSLSANTNIPKDTPFLTINEEGVVLKEQKFVIAGVNGSVSSCWLNNNNIRFPSVGLNTGTQAWYGQVVSFVV